MLIRRELGWSGTVLVTVILAAACARADTGAPASTQWQPAADPVAAASAPPPSTAVPVPSATRRPASASASARPTARPSPSRSPAPRPAAGGRRYAFPVVSGNVSYHPTHAVYPATDIFAACGEPVVAATDGRVLEVSRIDQYSKSGVQGPYNGGKSVSLLGDDGVRYYGSHLTEVAGGITAGVRVRAGQRLGTVGRTGNANNVCHLHFGISPPCGRTGDWWIRRGVVWPAPFLDAWRRRTSRSPADAVATWHRAHGCPSG